MNVDQAVDEVARFLRGMRYAERVDFSLSGRIVSLGDDQGRGVWLTGDEADAFALCLDHLVEADEKQNLFSRQGLERLLRDALIAVGKPEEGQAHLPEERIKGVVKELRKALKAKPRRYLVYLPVVGIDDRNLPVTVGKLTFIASDSPQVASLKEFLRLSIMSLLNTEDEKHAFVTKSMNDVDQHLASQTIVELEVEAGDDSNAGDKALAICRQSLDAINFFADILMGGGVNACVSIVGEGQQVETRLRPDANKKLLIALREKYDTADHALRYKDREIAATQHVYLPSGPLIALTLLKSDAPHESDDGHRLFARVSQLLAKDNPTKLEDRILSAVKWAGRATVDSRREEAFVMYMISLESLVMDRKNKTEITFQLTLRTAHLLKRTASARKHMYKRLGELYGIRSNIVHEGTFRVRETDLREIRQYAKHALVTVLLAKPFCEMTEEAQLDQWFKDSLIGGEDDTKAAGGDVASAEQAPET